MREWLGLDMGARFVVGFVLFGLLSAAALLLVIPIMMKFRGIKTF